MTKLRYSKLGKEEIEYIVARCLDKGAGNVMREDELAKGRRVLALGDEPWLSKDDWNEDIVISMGANRVFISAIVAKVSGRGSFSRLIDGILEAGLVPVVVCPFALMEAIVKRWNWRGITNHATNESHWFPQKKFKEKRKKMREQREAAERIAGWYTQSLTPSCSAQYFRLGGGVGSMGSGTAGTLGTVVTFVNNADAAATISPQDNSTISWTSLEDPTKW